MRSQSYLAKCDRRECKTVIEIESNTLAPEGWLQIRTEIDGKWDAASTLEFCSAKCVSIWSKNRGTYQNGNRNGTSRDIIAEAILILDGPFDYVNVSELITDSGITDNAIRQMLTTMANDGALEVVEKGKPGTGHRTTYKVVA